MPGEPFFCMYCQKTKPASAGFILVNKQRKQCLACEDQVRRRALASKAEQKKVAG